MFVTPARQTIFALLSALEADMRDSIRAAALAASDPASVLDVAVVERARARFERDTGATPADNPISELCDYVDFGDAVATLNRLRGSLPDAVRTDLDLINAHAQELVGIRNRIAHVRPLEVGDFAATVEFAKALASGAFGWPELHEVLARLRDDPTFVLGVVIPVEPETKNHNLPTPEWDETGFLGRKDVLRVVKQSIAGAYPVVSIVGEGGLGKTSLALKAAYDILDSPESPYDAIVWTTAKTTKLTVNEIERVEGAISTSLGLFQDVATELAGAVQDQRDTLDEVLQYLNEFKILLVLDNLETVLDDTLESFFRRLPVGSKVLTTSRIGLGKFEDPIKIPEMPGGEAEKLMRALARMRGLKDLATAPSARLQTYCRKLQNNPGGIRWFVSVVSTGVRPEDALQNQDVFLEFCMSNIYEHLSSSARGVLRVLLSVPGFQTQPELAHYTELPVVDLQAALSELMRTSMATRRTIESGSTSESVYEINELARLYLAQHEPGTPLEYELAKRKREELEHQRRTVTVRGRSAYDPTSLVVRSPSEVAVSRRLQTALASLYKDGSEDVLGIAEEVQRLAPEYFEAHRVLAQVCATRGDIGAAVQHFEAALDCEPAYAPLRVHFADFLANRMGDLDRARRELEQAKVASEGEFEVLTALTEVRLRQGDLEGAYESLIALVGSPKAAVSNQRDVLELFVHYCYANIEGLLMGGDAAAATTFMSEICDAVQEWPPEACDVRVQRRMQDAMGLLERASRELSATEMGDWRAAQSRMKDLINARRGREALELIGGPTRGVMAANKSTYGFIKGDDGEWYFVHANSLASGTAWDDLTPGKRVTFQPAKSPKGLKAITVMT